MLLIAVLFMGTVALGLCQSWMTRRLRQVYSQPSPEWPVDKPWPKAAILLSLRGHDPFLQQCIRNLVRQDYPNFKIFITVDSDSDPAWDAVRAVQAELGNGHLQAATLQNRRHSCSLKNSSIIEAITHLPADFEVVAFVDADAVTHPGWLKSLVAPLHDPQVGGTTGIRWFAPEDRSLGARMRCFWNLLAASAIYQSQTPWGGSMVLRRSILDEGLTDEWSRMFCEDAHTINFLKRRGLKLACAPEATVVNQETTSVRSCMRFVNRQMLIFRLYQRQWWSVVALIVFGALLRVGHIACFVHAVIWQQVWMAVALACIHPIVLFMMRSECRRLDRAVRRKVSATGQVVARNPLPDGLGYFCAEVMFLTSMLSAIRTRRVNWRGIKYRVDGPQAITMLAYQPYAQAADYAGTANATVI